MHSQTRRITSQTKPGIALKVPLFTEINRASIVHLLSRESNLYLMRWYSASELTEFLNLKIALVLCASFFIEAPLGGNHRAIPLKPDRLIHSCASVLPDPMACNGPSVNSAHFIMNIRSNQG